MAKATLKHKEPSVRTKVNLSESTVRKANGIKRRYLEEVGFDISFSLLVVMALEALDEDITKGGLRKHRDLYLTVREGKV